MIEVSTGICFTKVFMSINLERNSIKILFNVESFLYLSNPSKYSEIYLLISVW